MTDPQYLFNLAVSIAGGFGGWILKMIYDRLNGMNDELDNIRDNYARRDDVKDWMRDIKEVLQRIEHKLDGKADK